MSEMNPRELIIIIVLGSFLLIVSNGQNNSSICSEKNKRKISIKFTRLWVLGDKVRKFPETLDQIPKFCSDSMRYLNEMRAYNEECSERFSKRLASVLFYKIHQFIRDLCGENIEKMEQAFQVESFVCANAAQKELRKCNFKFIDDLENVSTLPVDHNKWPTVCCAYELKIKCYLKRGRKIEECLNGKIYSTIKYHETIASPIINSLCTHVLTGPNLEQKCKRIILLRRKSSKLVKKNRAKSMFFPFMKAVEYSLRF